jgi:hypothetical protein
MFDLGLAAGGSFAAVWGVFGSDGTVNGILNKSTLDTNRFTYTIDAISAGLTALTARCSSSPRPPTPTACARDGLRWIPKTNGEFKIPVVTLHTLGDLYVPFSMEQIYNKRVAAKGNRAGWCSARSAASAHCDFTIAEQVEAFEAMVKWEQRPGVKPDGDDVVTPRWWPITNLRLQVHTPARHCG